MGQHHDESGKTHGKHFTLSHSTMAADHVHHPPLDASKNPRSVSYSTRQTARGRLTEEPTTSSVSRMGCQLPWEWKTSKVLGETTYCKHFTLVVTQSHARC